MRKEVALQPPERPIDRVRDQRDDHKHDQDRLPLTPPLRHVDEIAKTTGVAAKLHEFRQHDVAKRQPKKEPE